MRQMFADMLGAVGQSLMETGDLRGMGRAMQAMQLASSNRRKSAQEQRAIVSILRQSGMPEDMANEISVTPALAQMGLSTFMATREQDAAMQGRQEAASLLSGGSPQGQFNAPGGEGAPSQGGAQPGPTPIYAPQDRERVAQLQRILASPNAPSEMVSEARAELSEMRQRSRPSGDPAVERKIALMMESGVDRETAIKIATGVLGTDRDPMTGETRVIDKSTGMPISSGRRDRADAGGTPQGDGVSALPGATDFLTATGLPGVTASIANTVSDLLGGGLAAPEAERAAQALTNLRARTMTTLATEIAGRPSNYLMEMYSDMAVTPNNINMGPERAKERFMQTHAMLADDARAMQTIIDNQDRLPRQQVGEALVRMERLKPLIRDYELIINGFESDRTAPPSSGGQADAAPGADEETQRLLELYGN
jgi:hypothetical protein